MEFDLTELPCEFRTRNGLKAVVETVAIGCAMPLRGKVTLENGKESKTRWTSAGASSRAIPSHFHDLVAPWELRIEAGKFYRTRNGLKAHVMAHNHGPSRGNDKWIGVVKAHGGVWEVETWAEDGSYFADRACDSTIDLVAEWEGE